MLQWRNLEVYLFNLIYEQIQIYCQLGDIVKIGSGERAPADLVILDSYEQHF